MTLKRKGAACLRPTSKESSFTDCPACQMKVVSYLINHHLDWDCLALVRNKEQPLIMEAAETNTMLSNCPEGILGNREEESHAQIFQELEAKLYDKLPYIKKAEDRLPVNKAETELKDPCCVHNVNAEGEKGSLDFVPPDTNFHCGHIDSPHEKLQGGLIFVPLDTNSHYGHIDGSHKRLQDVSSEKSTAFKLNAYSSNELGSKTHTRQADASLELERSTDFCHENNRKQFCSVFSTTTSVSNVDDFECNREIKEHISCNCEELLNSGNFESSGEASPKKAKKDGWEFITASLPAKVPRGHYVIENFISEKEEQELVSFLDMDVKNPWKVKTFNGLHLRKAYGLSPDLRLRRILPAAFEMPEILAPVFERMRTTVPALKDFWPNEMNAIDYCKHKGHWLKPHVDDRQLSGTILVNLSFCGDCKMTYERERGPRESYKVLLRQRCIQIQTGDCRYNFTHSILKEDLLAPRRVSMTFRKSVTS